MRYVVLLKLIYSKNGIIFNLLDFLFLGVIKFYGEDI